ncbi:MAG: DUF1538 domain-containing protein [Firmicutes bacterium]|nr:DUF1538 domain-containing protein [Bacillota bacterium]
MNIITSKLRDVVISVSPITAIVLLIHFFIVPIETVLLSKFLIGALLVVAGLVVFLLGVDLGITPLGSLTGVNLAKSNKLWLVIIAGLILGFFISIAEPGLMVLASQVDLVTSGQFSSISLLVIVSVGMAILIASGFLRIFFDVPLYKMIFVIYMIIFGLAIFSDPVFLAIAFDASGATTGIMAVPFILALSTGISKLKKDSEASENDSFGLVALASSGAILGVLVAGLFNRGSEFIGSLETDHVFGTSVLEGYLKVLPGAFKDTVLAIVPLLIILLVLQRISFKLNQRDMRSMVTGFIFAFIGLFLFLLGVNAGFMDVATLVGMRLAQQGNNILLVVVSFFIGVVTIIAEPAVYVLTQQIEEVTSGSVKKGIILLFLAIGVGIAVAISVIRILVPSIQLWHYLVPGYIVGLGLMFMVPKLFVGIAFDAGGVATGPVTATFVLAFIQGVAGAFDGANLMVDGFGMIAMVAMWPIITLQTLGFLFRKASSNP